MADLSLAPLITYTVEQVLVKNLSRPLTARLQVGYCRSYLCRLRGLTFRKRLPTGGLLMVQRRESRLVATIHMLGVFFDLAVIWLNQDLEVVDLCLAKRWRPLYSPRRAARYVLETAPDRLDDFRLGDLLELESAYRL